MPALRSRTVTHGRNMAGARALMRATGVEREDFGKPIVAVANSFTEFVPGHIHLREVAEVVLLEVKITPGQKYSGLIQSGAFKISDDGGADYRYDQTSGVEAEMKAAGYDPFEDVARRDGGTHQGWIAYVPDEKQDTYKIRYERGAGKVMGTDEKVPEFTTTFDIPSA